MRALTLKSLRILPPFAIARLGSAAEPLDNYTIETDLEANAKSPLDFRPIRPAATLVVSEETGEITASVMPSEMAFKTGKHIRPVCPFLEVFAVTEDDQLVPLTTDLLSAEGLSVANLSWRVSLANRKVSRRTANDQDAVICDTGWFNHHDVHALEGRSPNFISHSASLPFGSARFLKPNEAFPEIRLRFTPGKGLIYGPSRTQEEGPDPVIPKERAIYDATRGWLGFGAETLSAEPSFRNETLPPSLFAIDPPAPSWLFDNKAVSRGYLDDACDGFVEVSLTLDDGAVLHASARVCAAPPALVPDSLFVRCLSDDLDQVINGPEVAEDEDEAVTRARAVDIIRRAYETVRFMNVQVMNGNDFKGRPALSLDSMAQEEAADTERAIRPIMASGTVDTLAIMTLHEQVFAALRGGAAPWFLRLMRQPDEAADFTDRGRRKMPALMCGADNNYLALTYRQIDTIRKAATQALAPPRPVVRTPSALTPRNLSAHINYEAAGNPISSRPITSVANCCPGLEVDFRAVWRRMFKGLVLREWDNLVVDVDHDCEPAVAAIKGHRLLRVYPPGNEQGIAMMTEITGPASSDMEGQILLTTDLNPSGLAPLEWSNALAQVLSTHKGELIRCDFSKVEAWEEQQPWIAEPANYVSLHLEVRPFFEGETAVIAPNLAMAGELTQGLCSPWQNDYRECSCYYWASARPDYVNVEPGPAGLSKGDNWLQKERTGDYVPDDYADNRLILYDDLFLEWEHWLRFQVGGKDVDGPVPMTRQS